MSVVAVAGYCTAITTIVVFVVGILKVIKKIDKVIDDFDENTILTLKLVIINEHLPLSERVEAGRKYIDKGGNGAVKKLVQELETQQYNELLK